MALRFDQSYCHEVGGGYRSVVETLIIEKIDRRVLVVDAVDLRAHFFFFGGSRRWCIAVAVEVAGVVSAIGAAVAIFS